MNRVMQRTFIGLATMLMFGLATGATSELQRTTELEQDRPAPTRPFKLRAAGQIDVTTGTIAFGGVATHLGLYTANGFFNPFTGGIAGTMEAANGDTLDFTALFTIGPLGQLEATFNIAGGTGRFAEAVGTASGPVTLDDEFAFLIRAVGDLDY